MGQPEAKAEGAARQRPALRVSFPGGLGGWAAGSYQGDGPEMGGDVDPTVLAVRSGVKSLCSRR